MHFTTISTWFQTTICCVCCCLNTAAQQQKEALPFELNGNAQGTTWHILYYATAAGITQEEINGLLETVDSSMSIYKPWSLINQFNATTRGIKADNMLKEVVLHSQQLCNETGGVFDITVLPLVEAWGFGASKPAAMPDTNNIKGILPCIGTGKLAVIGDSLIKQNPCVKIDVNGIAQGYSVDLIASYLISHGIDNFLVELGGELRVKGRKPNGDNLIVGIEAPTSSPLEPSFRKKIQLPNGGAITTSGNYRKFLVRQGKRISHLIDPHTGFPFQNELIAVTVIAGNAITADGLDNALMGMGLQKALSFMQNRKEHAFFIYLDEKGNVKDTATNGFAQFVLPE